MNPIPIISFSNFSEVQKYMTLTNHLFSPYTFMVNRAMYEGLTPDQQATMHLAAQACMVASRGLARAIEASDRGLAGLMEKMTVTALNDETRQGFVNAAQPAFEQHIANNLDAKATELLNLMKSELKAANSANYMQD
jgi:TRAP-type C4-dicarboxylate transport system substrate-binding protein